MPRSKTKTKVASKIENEPKVEPSRAEPAIIVRIPLRRGRPDWPPFMFENIIGLFDSERQGVNSKGYKTLGIMNTLIVFPSPEDVRFYLAGLQHMLQTNEEKNEIRLIGPNSQREDFDDPEGDDISTVRGVWNTAWIANRPELIETARYMLETGKGVVSIQEANRRLTAVTTRACGTRGRYSPYHSGMWKLPKGSVGGVTLMFGRE